MYVKLSNGKLEKYSLNNLYQDNPQTSFPENLSEELLANLGIYLLIPVDPPQVDYTKNVIEGEPKFIDGKYIQVWNIVDASSEEIKQRIKDQEITIRAERDQKLEKCDWVIIKNYENKVDVQESWLNYRQQLRDVPTQTGFPWNVIWPTQP